MVAVILLCSCGKSRYNPHLVLDFGDYQIKHTEILFYDSSAHLLCLTKYYPQFAKYFSEPGKFIFRIDDGVLFHGDIWPATLSSLPTDHFTSIYSTKDGIFYLVFERLFEEVEDHHLIKQLKTYNKVKHGLSLRIDHPTINGNLLTYDLVITNHDPEPLLILDADKVGFPLLNYFTGFTTLFSADLQHGFSLNTDLAFPDSTGGFNLHWLSPLPSGSQKRVEFRHILIDIPKGSYSLLTRFTGPNHLVSLEEIYQPHGRIWLGQIKISAPVTIP